MKINRYRRGDGILFAAEEGSATDEVIKRDGSFQPWDDSGNVLPESTNEDNSQADKSALEQNKTKSSAGSGGAAKRVGARGKNKTKDAAGDKEGAAVGKDPAEESSDGAGDAEESAEGSAPESDQPGPGSDGSGVPPSVEEGTGSGN